MNKALLQNWLTTTFGILAGLPVIVAGSGLILNPTWMKWLTITAGIGVIGLGVVSKAFNTHSTEAQVAASTAVVTAVTPVQVASAETQVKAADAQVAAKK